MFTFIKPFYTGKLNLTYNNKICVLWWYKKILLKKDKRFSLQSNSWYCLMEFFALRGKATQVLIYIVTKHQHLVIALFRNLLFRSCACTESNRYQLAYAWLFLMLCYVHRNQCTTSLAELQMWAKGCSNSTVWVIIQCWPISSKAAFRSEFTKPVLMEPNGTMKGLPGLNYSVMTNFDFADFLNSHYYVTEGNRKLF